MAVEPSTYLGFPFAISDRDVTVGHPVTGRKLAAVSSVPKARAFVKGWRRAERQENDRDRRLTLDGSAPTVADGGEFR